MPLVCATVTHTNSIIKRLPPLCSIFTAELLAIREAVSYTLLNNNGTHLTIFSDSQSALSALVAHNPTHSIICSILSLLLDAHRQQKFITVCWVPSHVGVAGNYRADSLATQAATSNEPLHNIPLPYRDYFPTIRSHLTDLWQANWTRTAQNKLRVVKPTVSTWQSSTQPNRRHEVVLCRLRIGHTRLTHSYLLSRDPQPYCEDCLVPLTVIHILAECPTNRHLCHRLFPSTINIQDQNQILSIILAERNHTYNILPLIQYLRSINIFDLI